MTSAFSWQNSVSLFPASFTPGVSWFPTFAFQSPVMKKGLFFGISSRKSCMSHRTALLQLLQCCWSGHRLGLLWYWMVCLGNDQRSYCHFWDCFSDSFVDYDGYSISSKGLLPTVVDTMVIKYREWKLCEKEGRERIRDGQRKSESIVPVLSPLGRGLDIPPFEVIWEVRNVFHPRKYNLARCYHLYMLQMGN